jgi:isopentenyl phosphate kinase
LQEAGLSASSLPASASVLAKNGDVYSWDLQPLKMALQAGLLPVIYGDVVFDILHGGTILSTEDLFMHLARQLLPDRLMLAGIEPGVWRDFPHRTRILSQITSENLPELADSLGGSNATDVTGGMRKKVEQSLELSQEYPELEIMIFSGEEPGTLQEVLSGAHAGTIISYH